MILRYHNNLHLTKGALRSLLVDVQRKAYFTIPNDMHDLLYMINSKAMTQQQVVEYYPFEEQSTVLEYLSWLSEHEITFECPVELHRSFLEVPRDPGTAMPITSSIIDVEFNNTIDLPALAQEIDLLGCPSVQFRDFNGAGAAAIRQLLTLWSRSRISKIYVVLRYSEVNMTLVNELLTNPRVMSVMLHGVPKEVEMSTDPRVYTTSHILSGPVDCGQVAPNYFALNNRCLSVSKAHNTCLFQKVSVSSDGHIRNCPSHNTSFGHVSKVRLSDVIHRDDFQAPWHISKDSVEVCRDCEFRRICSDCRVYTHNDSVAGKPAKCLYDPYTCTYE